MGGLEEKLLEGTFDKPLVWNPVIYGTLRRRSPTVKPLGTLR